MIVEQFSENCFHYFYFFSNKEFFSFILMKYFLLLIVGTVGWTQFCPPGAVKSTTSNVCYIFSSITATFIQAQFNCTEQGGNLVNIDSQIINILIACKFYPHSFCYKTYFSQRSKAKLAKFLDWCHFDKGLL